MYDASIGAAIAKNGHHNAVCAANNARRRDADTGNKLTCRRWVIN